jgi:hypothetical protein
MEEPDNQEQTIFDRNYENALQRVVDAYGKRGAPDEDPRDLNLQLDILTSGHVLRMVKQLMLLRRDRPADLELDIDAAGRVTGMLEQLILLRGDVPCSSRH